MNEIIGTSLISKEMMAEVQGGGNGYLSTISGDCNTSKTSCWVVAKRTMNQLFAAVL